MPRGAWNIEGNLHVDQYLTNFQLSWIQDENNFVSMEACSVIPVNNQSDKFVIYDRGYFLRDEAKLRPLGGRPEQVGYKLGEGAYSALEYALEHIIDDRQRRNAGDPINLDENATRLLTSKMMIKQERIWAQAFFTAGKWTTELQGVGSGPGNGQFLQFDDVASDPVAVIDAAKDAMHKTSGFMPNVLVLGADVKRMLRSNPAITDRIKYTQRGVANDEVMTDLFEVETVLTTRALYNAAAEGETNNFQYIADSKAMLLLYIDKNPVVDSPTSIVNFAWNGLVPGQSNRIGGVMERGRDDRAHSDYFQNRMAFDMKQTAADLGVFFKDAVQ